MLNRLLDKLSQRKLSDIVYNQYTDKDILNNLNLYLNYLLNNNPKILLLGEAPGYKGCRLTGIPFTSGAIIRNSSHSLFREIGEQIKLREGAREITAAILWKYLEDNNKKVPILWNAFPFHPHQYNGHKSNRRPTKSEIDEGKDYIKIICEIFEPEWFCSLGRVGEMVLREVFPDKRVVYIRHPSRGGKEEFIKGMSKLYGAVFGQTGVI